MAFYELLGLREIRRYDSDQGRFTLVYLAAPGQEGTPLELTYNWDGDQGLPSDQPPLWPSGPMVVDNIYENLPDADGQWRHHQPSAARRSHGLYPLPRQYLD